MEKQTAKRLSRPTWYIISALIIVSVVIAIFFGAQWWLGDKIRKEIDSAEFTYNGSTVSLNVKQVVVRLLDRSVKISGVSLNGTIGGEPWFSVILASGSLNIEGLNLKMLDSDTLRIPAVELRRSDIDINIYNVKNTDNTRKKDAPQKPFAIAALSVKEGNIRIRSHDGQHTSETLISNLDLDVENAYPSLIRENILPTLARSSFSLAGITQSNGDSTLISEYGHMSYDNKEGRFSMESVSITPQLEPAEFARINYRHSDWTSLSAGPVMVYGIDTAALSGGRISIDSLVITEVDIKSLKNRNVYAVPKVKKMFHEKLQSIPFPLSVGFVSIGPTDVAYSEIAQGESEAGIVEFKGLTGEFHNLTNRGTAGHPFFTLEARGKLYGRADIAAKFHIPADSTVNRFEVAGHISDMPLTMINRIITPLENAEIKMGHLDRMDFNITGSRSHASSRGTLLYHGLNLTLLKHNAKGEKERRFVTWIANKALLSNNPHNGITKHAEGQTGRDFHRSQFNYLWHSLLALVEDTIKPL